MKLVPSHVTAFFWKAHAVTFRLYPPIAALKRRYLEVAFEPILSNRSEPAAIGERRHLPEVERRGRGRLL
jgi:hypothetical protein